MMTSAKRKKFESAIKDAEVELAFAKKCIIRANDRVNNDKLIIYPTQIDAFKMYNDSLKVIRALRSLIEDNADTGKVVEVIKRLQDENLLTQIDVSDGNIF